MTSCYALTRLSLAFQGFLEDYFTATEPHYQEQGEGAF